MAHGPGPASAYNRQVKSLRKRPKKAAKAPKLSKKT